MPDIYSKCLGNVMRVNVGPLGGNLLEVAVVTSKLIFWKCPSLAHLKKKNIKHFLSTVLVCLSSDNSVIPLTPSLASQCGFSMKTDQLGNTVIYASLQNCFAQNVVTTLEISFGSAAPNVFFNVVIILSLISVCSQADKAFTTTLNLRLHGNRMVEDELYQVAETCHYTSWASREIVCDRSYMEASECNRTLRGHVAVYMISGFISPMSIRAASFDVGEEGGGEIDYRLWVASFRRCPWKEQLQMITPCLNIPAQGLIHSLGILDELLRFDEPICFFQYILTSCPVFKGPIYCFIFRNLFGCLLENVMLQLFCSPCLKALF